MSVLSRWLQHPLTRDLSLDDPRTTGRRHQIIQSKRLLRNIYLEWYRLVVDSLPAGGGAVLELGSGAGFLRQVMPDAITSEVFPCPGVALVADGQCLPFRDGRLRAVVMIDVLHHIPDCRRFFLEAARVVRPGGTVIAIEPWVTAWSRLIYRHLHYEPFRPHAPTWDFPTTGPLSGSNQALPWIIFERDRVVFEREYPQWSISRLRPMMPFSYLASGGVGLRKLAPDWTTAVIVGLERLISPFNAHLAMFVHIVLTRTTARAHDAPSDTPRRVLTRMDIVPRLSCFRLEERAH